MNFIEDWRAFNKQNTERIQLLHACMCMYWKDTTKWRYALKYLKIRIKIQWWARFLNNIIIRLLYIWITRHEPKAGKHRVKTLTKLVLRLMIWELLSLTSENFHLNLDYGTASGDTKLWWKYKYWFYVDTKNLQLLETTV